MPRLFVTIVAVMAASTDRATVGGTHPDDATVLVELFTSEGCSSCPPADALLGELTRERPPGTRVIGLGEHVDYWDGPAWRDRFSSPLFSQRQETYARRLRLSSVYTPQFVVAGRADALGSDRGAAQEAIDAAARERSGRVEARILSSEGGARYVTVTAAWTNGVTADVLLAVVQDRATTRVHGGENFGRMLRHVDVVRSLTVIGRGTGTFSGRVPLARLDGLAGWHLVAFVQERDGGPVVGATIAAAP